MPLIDEHVRAIGREVRELARLHGELARTEFSDGVRRLVIAIFLFAVGVAIGALALAALGFAVFFLLQRVLETPGAAALVAVSFFALMMVLWLCAWRVFRGSSSLGMPRTRQMIWELLQWRDKPNDS